MLRAPPEKATGVSWFRIGRNLEHIGDAQLRWFQVKRSHQRTTIPAGACMHNAAQPTPDQHVAVENLLS